ncbi:hypothetical protein EVAR_40221_1 [Eumeta japonica]|uniref:Uncharacterized protein n=1 Tax=Eumeta variegata TaxID=151549 RepID=A0A4C1XBZ1_EUMVA|nr:hypothetical protein EVAR_40221_1 [Eumeta japonica]
MPVVTSSPPRDARCRRLIIKLTYSAFSSILHYSVRLYMITSKLQCVDPAHAPLGADRGPECREVGARRPRPGATLDANVLADFSIAYKYSPPFSIHEYFHQRFGICKAE